MTKAQWQVFCNFREGFKRRCDEWNKVCNGRLKVIYNSELNEVDEKSCIKLILLADNPGEKEALVGKYLVGSAGKLFNSFLSSHEEMGLERKDIIILNKTPIHTKKTIELRQVPVDLLHETLEYMAKSIFTLHKSFKCKLWIVGYSQMKSGGVFKSFRDFLWRYYKGLPLYYDMYLYQHFSRNCFNSDLKKSNIDLLALGVKHKDDIFACCKDNSIVAV